MKFAVSIMVAVLATVSVATSHADNVRGLVPEPGEFRRRGLALGFAVGPSAVVEFGDLVDVTGLGAGPSLRVGTSAGERLVWFVQGDGMGYLFSAGDDTGVNQLVTISVVAQTYLRSAFWLKTGLGLANYRQQVRRQVKLDPVEESGGGSIVTGVGVDVYQENAIAIGIEFTLTTVLVPGSVLLQGWAGVGFHIY